jgi:hypothetical protein
MPSKMGRRIRNTSSSASSWSAAQKNTYAKMNAANSRKIATTRMRNYGAPSSRSGGGSGVPKRALGNSNPLNKLYFEIGNNIKRATKR